ncbi:mucin-7-like [Mya arenaria]|uniref:mucin-7-like n=1 Tax=Mya arenaria TaxID=6604 RepID=UPI0022E4ED62|nr:mucin-7-like [Mya arenaria]
MPLNLNDLRSPTPISISEPLVDAPTTPDLNTPPNRSPHKKSATTVTSNGDSHDHSKPPASSNTRFTDSSITETTALPDRKPSTIQPSPREKPFSATIWNDHLNETTTPLSPSLLPSATSLFGIASFNGTSPFSDFNTPVTQSPSQDHLVTVPHLSDNTNPTRRSVPPTTDTQYSILTFQEATDAPNTNNFPPEYIPTPLTSTKLLESSAKSLLFTGEFPFFHQANVIGHL